MVRALRICTAVAFALLLPACDDLVAPAPFPTTYGMGGSGGIDVFIQPLVSVLRVGDTVQFDFQVYDRINGRYVSAFGDVTWINENPSIVRLESPLAVCGTRCARVTGLAPGYAQLRAWATYDRVETWGARGIQVVD